MKIQWGVEDGYSGKSRPHFLEIDDSELEQYETKDEKVKYIGELIQEEFDNRIYWYCDIESYLD